MDSEAKVIGRFVPSEYTPEVIQAELRRLLPACCACENIGVRRPQGVEPHPDNLEWHQDGMPAYHMVVWANETPTEIKDSSGTELEFAPFDIIWFDNTKVMHRQPRSGNEWTRWHACVRCSGAIF